MKLLIIAAALILVLHGLVHLMGMAVYMGLTTFAGFPYKTTLLNGHWDLGSSGISMFGGLRSYVNMGSYFRKPAPNEPP